MMYTGFIQEIDNNIVFMRMQSSDFTEPESYLQLPIGRFDDIDKVTEGAIVKYDSDQDTIGFSEDRFEDVNQIIMELKV